MTGGIVYFPGYTSSGIKGDMVKFGVDIKNFGNKTS